MKIMTIFIASVKMVMPEMVFSVLILTSAYLHHAMKLKKHASIMTVASNVFAQKALSERKILVWTFKFL